MNIMDWLIALGGVYLIYTAIMMKTKGKIVKNVVIGQDVDIEKIRDKAGFIQYMWGRVLILGILSVVVGCVGIISANTGASVTTYLISFIGYFVLLIWFAVVSVKGRKRFIE